MTTNNVWAEYLHMVKRDIKQVTTPDELLAMAQVIVHTLDTPDTRNHDPR